MLYLDIFDRGYLSQSPVTGISVPSDINYLRRLYTFNKDSIEQYYLDRSFTVKNTHILSRFLEHLSPHFSYDSYRYIEYVDDKVRYLAKHFKFTSDIEKGLVHPPYFFGNEGEEIIMVEYEPFDVKDVVKNWRTAPCIKIVTQPRNDTKLLLPLGNDDGSRGGLSVISLDPLKLALKYREFMREQYKNTLEDGIVLNKNHFVMKYVLNTTVEDYTDHMLLNKVMDKFYNQDEMVPRFKHKFKIFEPNAQLDRYVDETLNVISERRLDFVNIMNNIQLIFSLTASDLLALPEMSGTRQSRWALIVSRLKYMCFIYDVSKDKERNKHFINDWKRLVQRLEQDKGLLGNFSSEVLREIEDYMYRIKQM